MTTLVNKKQSKVADKVLHLLAEHDGRMNVTDLYYLFTEKERNDGTLDNAISLLFRKGLMLENGCLYELTDTGEEVTDVGLTSWVKNQKGKKKVAEWMAKLSLVKIVVDIIIAVASFVLGRCSVDWF